MKKKNVIILAIAMIIVIAGVIVASTIGFNKQLRYQDSQKIDIYVASEVDVDKIKSIANEVLGKQNMVQTIEIYQDMVTIRAKSISDEQKDSIVNKIKENYEFEQTAEKTEIKDIPATRIRDMFKKYVLPFVLSFIIILVYMVVRYRQKGILNVFAQTMAIPVLYRYFSALLFVQLPPRALLPWFSRYIEVIFFPQYLLLLQISDQKILLNPNLD